MYVLKNTLHQIALSIEFVAEQAKARRSSVDDQYYPKK